MIEEVVNSILEAEDVAQQKVVEAKRQANEIVARAETDADNFKKQASAHNKEYFLQQSRQIELQSSVDAKEKLAELKAQSEKEVAAYEKNVGDAVKIILEQLL